MAFSILDDDGFIVNTCSTAAIEAGWWPTVEATIDEYRQRYDDLISVYIRGSVASGDARVGFSDLDAVAVLAHEHAIDRGWCDAADGRVRAKHQCASEITFSITPVTLAASDRKTGFFLKTHAALVYGEDVIRDVPPYRIDRDAISHLFNLRDDWATCERVCAGPDRTLANLVMRRLAKRIVRSGLELVAEREQAYTRDLDLCTSVFAKSHPSQADRMATIAHLVAETELLEWMPAFRDMVDYLATEAEATYPGHVVTTTYIDDLGVD